MGKRNYGAQNGLPAVSIFWTDRWIKHLTVQHLQPAVLFHFDGNRILHFVSPVELQPLQLRQHFRSPVFLGKANHYQFCHLPASS